MNDAANISDRTSSTGGRRAGIERREFTFTAHVPERRSGDERRGSQDRRLNPRSMNDANLNTDQQSDKN